MPVTPRLSIAGGLAVGAVALVITILGADAALAQSGPFGVPRPPAVPADGVIGWLLAEQARFYRALSGLIRAAKVDGSATWTLLGVSFLYGVFHAAGPGHGKAVISSYLIANQETWRRGIVLSFASALLQAAVAVAVVAVAAIALGATAKTMNTAVSWIEVASYALIALIGARLVWTKGGSFVRALRARQAAVAEDRDTGSATEGHGHPSHDHASHLLAACLHEGHAHKEHSHARPAAVGADVMTAELAHADAESSAAHEHVHHGHHEHAHHEHREHAHDHGAGCGCGHDHGEAQAHDHVHAHDHDHDHGSCGHAHGPEPQDLAGPGGWSRGLAAIVAVGLRPCSGAILVLVFAFAQGLFWAGVASTFVMGLGTAITVAGIATLAVGAKALANRLLQHRSGRGALVLRGIEVAAALAVLVFGVALLTGYVVSERMI